MNARQVIFIYKHSSHSCCTSDRSWENVYNVKRHPVTPLLPERGFIFRHTALVIVPSSVNLCARTSGMPAWLVGGVQPCAHPRRCPPCTKGLSCRDSALQQRLRLLAVSLPRRVGPLGVGAPAPVSSPSRQLAASETSAADRLTRPVSRH